MRIEIQYALNKGQASNLNKLVRDLVQAEVADSWKGGGDPGDIEVIEAELALAKARFSSYVRKLVRDGK